MSVNVAPLQFGGGFRLSNDRNQTAVVVGEDEARALLRDLGAALGETLVSDLLEKVDQMAKNAPTFMQEKAAQGTAHTIGALTAKGGVMCNSLTIDNRHITTIGSLRTAIYPARIIWADPDDDGVYPETACLCSVDLEATAAGAALTVIEHDGDPMEVVCISGSPS